MSVVEITSENYEEIILKSDGVVMIDCWASWCDACEKFQPIFEKTAEKYGKHTFGAIDATKQKELIKEFGVENIPALLLFREGILIFKQPGYFEEEKLEDIIMQAENLDMEMVKAHIRESEKKNKSE